MYERFWRNRFLNYETIKTIIATIKQHEKTLEVINSKPIIIVKRPFCDEKISIETYDYEKQDMGCYAEKFVGILREDIENRISNLKSQLDLL
jgi:hypothetical protein